MIENVTCLAGGVGAAKLLQGLINVMPQENLTVIVNVGDDIELHGLHISPDPDIIMYTLASIVDEEKGWGIQGDTFNFVSMLKQYGLETWFKLGDKDLATHVYRTCLIKEGVPLSGVIQKLCRALGLKINLLPVTNQKIVPQILTNTGKMHFEEYLVKRGARDRVLDVTFEGAELARPAPGVIKSIQDADGIIVCPSNPIVSIGPILAVKEVRSALTETSAKVVAISPIVGGSTIKGPADKLMRGLGLDVSAFSVASLYRDFLDTFILDNIDEKMKENIAKLGIEPIATDTIMKSLQDKVNLATRTLQALL